MSLDRKKSALPPHPSTESPFQGFLCLVGFNLSFNCCHLKNTDPFSLVNYITTIFFSLVNMVVHTLFAAQFNFKAMVFF